MNGANTDVLIVGAGPGGLVLANDLATRGVGFRIVDVLPEAVQDSRAHGMIGATLTALERLDLAAPLLAAAKKPTPVLREFYRGKLIAETDFVALPRDPYPVLLPIFQQRIVRVLEAGLMERGHCVEWSTQLVSFAMDEGGVLAELDHDGRRETVHAGWIVGSDGGHNTVRKTLESDFKGRPSGLIGLICECDLNWERSRDIWWTWHGYDGVAAAIFNDFTGQWHVLILERRTVGTIPNSSKLALIGKRLREYSGDPNVRLSNASKVDETTTADRMARRFVEGRAILLGDAAHLFAGAAGHGIRGAVDDALNLGWKLALMVEGNAAPDLLRTYEIERRRHAEEVIRKTQWTLRFMATRGALAWAVRGAIFTLRKHLGAIATIAGRQSKTLASDYGASPLTCQESRQAMLWARAGNYLPDAECRIGGEPSRLREILRSPGSNLLLFAGAAPSADILVALKDIDHCMAPLAPHLNLRFVFRTLAQAHSAGFAEDDPRVIIDATERLQAAYGTREPELMYIRPDGYIGRRSTDLCVVSLFRYLRRIYAQELLAETFAMESDESLAPSHY
jgi:2-polyprenyl-6-methoxyphenol hydroxylase-like FAD-dependent oxidoreductase